MIALLALAFFTLMIRIYVTQGEIMNRRLVITALIFGMAVVPDGILFAQAKDPLIGQWMLNRGKSEYHPDSTLQSRTLELTVKDGGVSFVQKTVTDRGNTVTIDFTAKYDDKDVPISGSQLDTVALKKIDGTTVQRSGKTRGMVTETVTMKLSADGKTLTVTTKGSADGDDYSSMQVFEKQ